MKELKRNKKGRFVTKDSNKKHIIRVTLEEKQLIEDRRKNQL